MKSGPSGHQPLLEMTHFSLPGRNYHSLSQSMSPSYIAAFELMPSSPSNISASSCSG